MSSLNEVTHGYFTPLDLGWNVPSPLMSEVAEDKDAEKGDNGTGEAGAQKNERKGTRDGRESGGCTRSNILNTIFRRQMCAPATSHPVREQASEKDLVLWIARV